MARRPVLWLALLGLLSVATYWCAFAWPYGQSRLVASGSAPDIALLTDRSPVACALYVGAVTLLFGLYLAAVRLASRLRGSSAHVVVITCGLASAIILCHVYPYAASDLFLYIVRGRVLGVHGQNPMLVPQCLSRHDPVSPVPQRVGRHTLSQRSSVGVDRSRASPNRRWHPSPFSLHLQVLWPRLLPCLHWADPGDPSPAQGREAGSGDDRLWLMCRSTPLWAGGWNSGQASRGFTVSALGLSLGCRFSSPFGSIVARPADRCARANGPPAESTHCGLTRSCILTRTRPTPIIAM